MPSPNLLQRNASNPILSMIRLLLSWAPFDGGDEEIFPTFGYRPRALL